MEFVRREPEGGENMRQCFLTLKDRRPGLRGSWREGIIRLFMAIAGAPLLSCCGGKAPGPERRRSVGEGRDERRLTGGVPRKGFDIHTDGSGAGNLQPCSDTSGCGQNVGWIGTGGTHNSEPIGILQ